MAIFGNAGGLGDLLGDIPVVGELFDSKGEIAGEKQMASMADAAAAYEAYRPEFQAMQAQRLQNIGGMMGGLNDYVGRQTGSNMDLAAAMQPMIAPPQPVAPPINPGIALMNQGTIVPYPTPGPSTGPGQTLAAQGTRVPYPGPPGMGGQ